MRRSDLENWRVVVVPDLDHLERITTDTLKREYCHDIAKAVRRHVDGVENATTFCDRVETCSHCGSNWTEESDVYNGGCCDDDENEEMRRK